MMLEGFIKKGLYFDSVSLMNVSRALNRADGIMEASVVMGTDGNKAILRMSDMYLPMFDQTTDTDLLVSLKTSGDKASEKALLLLEELLTRRKSPESGGNEKQFKSLDAAISGSENINLALISVAGRYAAREAMTALKNGLNVMLFSDNVSLEDEILLKKYALGKDLLMMGPDCGTSIINGVPLAFANVVNRGNIGIVAASGTGLQEVSCLISEAGCGISQAIGTGGRDVKKEVGGLMFIRALKALIADPATGIIVLISKPPDSEVLEKIHREIQQSPKPVVSLLIGAPTGATQIKGLYEASSLEEVALAACALAAGADPAEFIRRTAEKETLRIREIAEHHKGMQGRYLRGLFSGGTLCDEAQLILTPVLGSIGSNTPLKSGHKLEQTLNMSGHCIIDLGDDEFTSGRSHPMIDFSLRMKQLEAEAARPDVGVILFDLVLGYGSNMTPMDDLMPVLHRLGKKTGGAVMICSVTGTRNDPQNREKIVNELESAGVVVMPSNASASRLAACILKNH